MQVHLFYEHNWRSIFPKKVFLAIKHHFSNATIESKKNLDECCAFHIGKKRCPLPGVVCDDTRSSDGKWYCYQHWLTKHNNKLAKIILEQALANYKTIMKKRQDWRNDFFNKH